MKKIVLLVIIFFSLTACAAPQAPLPTLVPVGTIVAQTMAALMPTAPPTAIPTDTPAPPPLESTEQITVIYVTATPGACLPAGERLDARVMRVISGDTIEVAVKNAGYIVKYIGIAAPRVEQPAEKFGPQALEFNNRMVGGQVVSLVKDVTDMDQQGRWPRYVLIGDKFVNYEMVKGGYARAFSQPPDTACDQDFIQLQAEAQIAAIGIWVPTPLPTSTPIPTPTITPEHSATPTAGVECNCEGHDLQCKDFGTHKEAQACFNYCVEEGYGDVFLLDDDGDGVVCRGLP
jgi:endonuclease YncB( thermonuclease family)